DELVRGMGRVTVYHLSVHRTSRLLYDVSMLAAAADADRQSRRALIARAARSARLALRIAGRVARERPEVYRLAGRLAWLRGRKGQALAWWERSVDEGERLGARPEVGRTYLEAGHSLRAGRRGGRLRTPGVAGGLGGAQRGVGQPGLGVGYCGPGPLPPRRAPRTGPQPPARCPRAL